MKTFKHLLIEILEDGVCSVKMNRPPANAVDQEMYLEIADLFANPDQLDGDLRVIILGAAGPHFCAGNDLEEFRTMSPENGTERMWRVREAFFAIQNCPIPVIAAVHGVALGTGLAIAASCDFIVALEDAKFGLPELTVGVMGGARHLTRIAPQPLVRRMYFTGEHMRASDFAAAGGAVVLVSGTVAELAARALSFAKRTASFSPTATRLAKQILNRIETMDMFEGYAFEQGFTVKMSGHPDSKEALKAFAERRKANYLPRAASWKIDV